MGFAFGVLVTLSIVFVFGTVALLLRDYWRTKIHGALLLAFALFFLPLLLVLPSAYVQAQVDHVVADEPAGWPFSMVAEGRATTGTLIQLFSLLKNSLVEGCTFLGVLLLLRSKKPPVAPSPAPGTL